MWGTLLSVHMSEGKAMVGVLAQQNRVQIPDACHVACCVPLQWRR